MGFINLLTSSFEGKLGEAYGVRQYGKHFAKAIPFSHFPKNKKSIFGFRHASKILGGTMASNEKKHQTAQPETVAAKHHKQVVKEEKGIGRCGRSCRKS